LSADAIDCSVTLKTSPSTYVICNHEWSFLEGERKHSHTLKAGRHFFPFQLQIGGSLPSSIATDALGGASIAYKLRARAGRPGLHNNLQAVVPISIVRSFTSEALEYQQTLEIENTWPEKLMYSIMIPHKAWAVGDQLTALVKFSPLAKGVRVMSITTTVNETTKVFARSGFQEHTCSVASVKHEVIGGNAVEVNENAHEHKPRHAPYDSQTIRSSPTTSTAVHHHHSSSISSMAGGSDSPSNHVSILLAEHSTQEAGPPSNSSTVSGLDLPGDVEESHDDVVTCLTLTIPGTVTPTHSLQPITVSHRIRWNVLILNLDGHTSELRCSLALHLLDYCLLDESRSCTSATRRLLIGRSETPSEADDMELPSYTAHVRDRVANMFLPQAATMRVSNPWIQSGISPTIAGRAPLPISTRSSSGGSSPLETQILSYFPDAPGSGNSTPLDWVNSELLLSQPEEVSPPLSRHITPQDSNPHNGPQTRPATSGRSSLEPPRSGSAADALPVAGPNETYVHSGQANGSLHSLFHASTMPFSSLPRPRWPSSRSNSHPNPVPHSSLSNLDQSRQQAQPRLLTMPAQDGHWSSVLHRAFTEVPDYTVALRGFIGGVPPLTSMQGLPSYAEAEISQNDSDLSAQSTQAMPTPCLSVS